MSCSSTHLWGIFRLEQHIFCKSRISFNLHWWRNMFVHHSQTDRRLSSPIGLFDFKLGPAQRQRHLQHWRPYRNRRGIGGSHNLWREQWTAHLRGL